MINRLYLTLPLLLFFTACQNKPSNIYVDNTLYQPSQDNKVAKLSTNKLTKEVIPSKVAQVQLQKDYKEISNDDKLLSDNNTIDMNKQFMDFYKEWKGVKYRFGGNSKKGIDCSAFTQRIYKEKFDIKIPRSTRTQVKVGKKIKKSELELGDLIFFKTGKIDRHVGIYMGNGEFMHASIKGVKFSKVDKPFYKRTYWTSRRIIN